MPPDTERLGIMALVRAGLRRSRWRSAAGILVSLVAACVLFSAITFFSGMQRMLRADVQTLSAEFILAPQGHGDVAEQLLTTGSALPLEATIPVEVWRQKLRDRRVVGILAVEGLDLTQGGAGVKTGSLASVVLVHLEEWASPSLAQPGVATAIPEADVVLAEQTTRQVARHLEPILHYLFAGASTALLAAVLMTGLLTAIRVAERRGQLGMMRAMGATHAFLIRLTLAESGFLAAAGSLVGVLIGLLFTNALPGEALQHLALTERLLYACGAALFTTGVAALAALGPALRAASMDPLDAARRGR